MQAYYYNPEVKLLLVNQSDKKEKVRYTPKQSAYLLPKIGPRPPYFTNPRYEPYYPVI